MNTDPFDKMEHDLWRAGGDTWRKYRRERERFIEQRVNNLGESRSEARRAWKIDYMSKEWV